MLGKNRTATDTKTYSLVKVCLNEGFSLLYPSVSNWSLFLNNTRKGALEVTWLTLKTCREGFHTGSVWQSRMWLNRPRLACTEIKTSIWMMIVQLLYYWTSLPFRKKISLPCWRNLLFLGNSAESTSVSSLNLVWADFSVTIVCSKHGTLCWGGG